MEQHTKQVQALRAKLAKKASARKSEYVIQSIHPDGFTYWWGGIQTMTVPGAKQAIKGSKWTPYWDDTFKFPNKRLAMEAVSVFGLQSCEVLLDKHADYHLAFDLTPARLELYMRWEQNQRKEFQYNVKEAGNDTTIQ